MNSQSIMKYVDTRQSQTACGVAIVVALAVVPVTSCSPTDDPDMSESAPSTSVGRPTDGESATGESPGFTSVNDSGDQHSETAGVDATTSSGGPDTDTGGVSGVDETTTGDQVESTGTACPITLLEDDFDAGLSGWIYQGHPGYSMSHDLVDGDLAPAIRIAGNCLASCDNGATKIVDIAQWTKGPLVLSLSFRATSSTPDSSVTNARIRLFDADTDQERASYAAVAGGVTDSGWQVYEQNIAPVVEGVSNLRIYLWMRDAWDANYSQVVRFDNVRLVGGECERVE